MTTLRTEPKAAATTREARDARDQQAREAARTAEDRSLPRTRPVEATEPEPTYNLPFTD